MYVGRVSSDHFTYPGSSKTFPYARICLVNSVFLRKYLRIPPSPSPFSNPLEWTSFALIDVCLVYVPRLCCFWTSFPSFVCLQHVGLKEEEEEDVKLGSKKEMRHDHDSNFLRQSPWCKIGGFELKGNDT